ncbi:MAG: hypothetical protein ACHQK8_07210 [Bacteroidia bacterium]
MRISFALAFIFPVLFFQSCDNTLDINAPYKETPVVFGFLDPGQTTQYIRITKTFQNSTNITPQQAAQDPNLLYFDTLVVKLVRIYTNPIRISYDTFDFYKTNAILKDQGYFSNALNFLYACDYKFDTAFKSNSSYKLIIYNPKSGNSYYAVTSIVGTAGIMTGNFSLFTLDFYYDSPDWLFFQWDPAPNAFVYSPIIRYHYKEGPKGQTPSTPKTVDQVVYPNIDPYHASINALAFNQFLINSFGGIDTKTGNDSSVFSRTMISIDYVVLAGSSDLATASNFSKPNTSLLQVMPLYSNIPDCIGLFTSRSTSIKPIPWNPGTQTKSIKNLTYRVCGFPQ